VPKSFVIIDKYRLDEEWIDQPKLYLQYADALADAEADETEAKAEMELVEAEVAAAVRDDPKEYGVAGRVTDAAVKSAVLRSREFQAAQKSYHECKRKVGHLKAAVRSLEHRKAALENEVYLHGQGYFADKPKSRLAKMGGGREARNEAAKRTARTPLRERDEPD